jgi:hypothetical protein
MSRTKTTAQAAARSSLSAPRVVCDWWTPKTRVAIFRPGIIAGNAHTPRYVAWLGRLVPGPFGTIEQDDIGRAFVAEFISDPAPKGVVYLENAMMRQKSRALK